LDKEPVETTLYSLDHNTPQPGQRRASERHVSLLRVGALMIGGRRELCLIRNVSAGGMLVRAYSNVAVGERLSIELKHGEAVSGTACWTKDDCIGISFDESIDVIDLISSPDTGPRPRMPRIEVGCAAWVREDGTVHRAKAVDISQGGIKLASAASLTPGSKVTVALNGLPPIAGLVRWKDENHCGISFNRVLALSQLVAWLQEQQGKHKRAAG
jgi:hypothetical protein